MMSCLHRFGSVVALTACVGAATAADVFVLGPNPEDRVPETLASPDLLVQHELATRMLPLMPAAHRNAIVAAGGFGAEHACDDAHHDERHALSPRQFAESVMTEDLAARMTDGQKNIFWSIVDTLEAGQIPPALCFAPDVDPAVAFAINQLIEFPLQIRFQQTNRWSSTATDGGGLGQGDPITLTYSFVPDGTTVPDLGIGLGTGPSALFAWLNGVYGNQNTWQNLFAQVFDRWSDLINVTYVFEPNDDGSPTNNAAGSLGVRGDLRIGAFDFQNDGNGGVLAYNNFPNDGDMIFDAFDTFYNTTSGNSLRFRNVAAHEHGHGMGMLHVCPSNQTKLMEPFVSTAYDGPQIDDILNGQRFYGDRFEPESDTTGAAPSVGSLGISGVIFVDNVSVDDNSDTDFYRFTLTQPARIIFSVNPEGGTYLQGPQTQACNGGTSTNYTSIHNLNADLRSAASPNTVLISSNSAGVGQPENFQFDAENAGTYIIRIGGDNTNSIQRYSLSIGATQLPFLVPQITATPPDAIDPGVVNAFAVTVDPRQDTLSGTPQLFFRNGVGAYSSVALVSNGGTSYTANLPAFACGSAPQFYISAVGQIGGQITLPAGGPATPFEAVVGQEVVTFADNFQANLGWTVTGPVVGQLSGQWERGVPAGDGSRGDAPDDFDGSGSCFVTGNGGPGSNTDVDGGQTILVSPAIDMSANPEAFVSYARWYDNTGSGTGAAPGADVFTVQISNNNGSTWTNLEVVGPNSAQSSGGWFQSSFRVADFVAPSSQIRVRFIADDAGDGSVIEAAVDAFAISGLTCTDPETCPADLAEPFGTLNFFDIQAYINLFNAQDSQADLAEPFGSFNFFDIQAYIAQFNQGCP